MQLEKVPSLIELILAGTEIDSKEKQLLNALEPIVCSLLLVTIDNRDEHPWKAFEPTVCNLLVGDVSTVSNEEQPI